MAIKGCFSCLSFYYSSKRGDRLITPDEQAAISQAFIQNGAGCEPVFDGYVTARRWE